MNKKNHNKVIRALEIIRLKFNMKSFVESFHLKEL